MKVSAKVKKAVATIRKELGFSQADMKNMLGDAVSLADIKDFENDKNSEDDFLVIYYFHIFHFIASERLEVEDRVDYELEKNEPVTVERFNPFKINPFKPEK